MRRKLSIRASAVILSLSALTGHAEEQPGPTPKEPAWSAQIRLRTEADGKNTTDSSKLLLSTQLRSRLGVSLFPSSAVELKLEVQDSRNLGSEPSVAGIPASATVGDSRGLDLHQAYVNLKAGGMQLTAGRQSLALGSQRFISSLEWHPVARTFDGLVGRYSSGPSALTAMTLLVRDVDARQRDDRDILSGVHYAYAGSPAMNGELYGFYDQSMLPFRGLPNYDLLYAGERLRGQAGWATYEEEFIYQGGETGELASSAFYLTLRLGAKSPMVSGNAGLDIMSGDDDAADGDNNAYIANYFFAHSFFGWMDYFAVNPNEGVMDWRLDGEVIPSSLWKLKGEFHFFTPQKAPAGKDDPYGSEIDLEAHLLPFPKVDIALGLAAFFPQASAIRLTAARGKEQTGYFIYLMPTFGF